MPDKNASKYFIKTFGCQMNRDDSSEMARLLRGIGMEEAADESDADLVHVNTCCVREKAEQKFFSYLGRLRMAKEKNGLLIGVSGCVPEKDDLPEKFPYIDYTVGSRHPMDYLPEIAEILHSKLPGLRDFVPGTGEVSPVFSFQTVIRGCTNCCTYCVVPSVRGPEKSVPLDEVYRGAKLRVESGTEELTFLGQNVLAYGLDLEPKTHLLDIMKAVHDLPGLKRLRFVTSHPAWMNEEFVRGMLDLPKVCEYFHIPFQAGDDEILSRMNRRYTADDYVRVVEMIRGHFPAAGISADAIVGFPGETEEHFQNTLRLIERAKVDNIYAFKYSPRPGTDVSAGHDNISTVDKKRRLADLNELQDRISRGINEVLIGTVMEIMIEAVFEKGGRCRGRTRTGKVTDFRAQSGHKPGDLVMVTIESATPHGIQGEEQT